MHRACLQEQPLATGCAPAYAGPSCCRACLAPLSGKERGVHPCSRCKAVYWCTAKCADADKTAHLLSGECDLLVKRDTCLQIGRLCREGSLVLRLLSLALAQAVPQAVPESGAEGNRNTQDSPVAGDKRSAAEPEVATPSIAAKPSPSIPGWPLDPPLETHTQHVLAALSSSPGGAACVQALISALVDAHMTAAAAACATAPTGLEAAPRPGVAHDEDTQTHGVSS
jgi:hypothetical protein